MERKTFCLTHAYPSGSSKIRSFSLALDLLKQNQDCNLFTQAKCKCKRSMQKRLLLLLLTWIVFYWNNCFNFCLKGGGFFSFIFGRGRQRMTSACECATETLLKNSFSFLSFTEKLSIIQKKRSIGTLENLSRQCQYKGRKTFTKHLNYPFFLFFQNFLPKFLFRYGLFISFVENKDCDSIKMFKTWSQKFKFEA